MKELIKCPFCSENDFDLWGLKWHLTNNCCPVFELSENELLLRCLEVIDENEVSEQ